MHITVIHTMVIGDYKTLAYMGMIFTFRGATKCDKTWGSIFCGPEGGASLSFIPTYGRICFADYLSMYFEVLKRCSSSKTPMEMSEFPLSTNGNENLKVFSVGCHFFKTMQLCIRETKLTLWTFRRDGCPIFGVMTSRHCCAIVTSYSPRVRPSERTCINKQVLHP